MKNKWSKNNLFDVINTSNNKIEVLTKLKLTIFTGNYDTLNKYIKKYNIDISHFKRNHNIDNLNNFKKIDLKNILVENSTYSRSKLKERLYKEGLKERKCEKCGQDEEWNGDHISLILDHINGINDDNRIENLRILCPNCNATLDTHCGKNVKDKSKTNITIKTKNDKYCLCGKNIDKRSKKCKSCNNIELSILQRKVERPTYDTLLKNIEDFGYSGTGRIYNVSDNTIRKWIKK
jgi:hypothetical protein